jgi:hypothetical protein
MDRRGLYMTYFAWSVTDRQVEEVNTKVNGQAVEPRISLLTAEATEKKHKSKTS